VESDAPYAPKAARLKGGAVQARRRRRKKRKPCPRKGTRAPQQAQIYSGVIQGADGPEIPDQPDHFGGVGVRDETIESQNQGVEEVRRGKGKKSDKGKGKAKETQADNIWTKKIVQAATVGSVVNLLSRFALLSNRLQCESLKQFATLLASYTSTTTSLDTSKAISLPTSRLASLVNSIEAIIQEARVNDLLRMLLMMNLAFEIDQ
jgi:hypothetical protein